MQIIEQLKYKNNALIQSIIEQEWLMFSRVEGLGGPAPCQSQKTTFSLMRYSQHQALSETFLISYQTDLIQAQLEGRNLFTDRYAYMMEKTDPNYYAQELAPYLPVISQENKHLIDEALAIIKPWEEDLRRKVPSLAKTARPSQDQGHEASSLTYMEGELKSYSSESLQAFLKDMQYMQEKSRNFIEEIFLVSQFFYQREEDFLSLLRNS